ncbi:TorD/DmsD family molecular chaperone [Tropicimonas isoalkanivorans]|jgi:TorA maturation chaperone TorD|uniref:Nitrate reductase delta subunit n=1 Tax=Tropicimonas isoalkanivorans TaxID=441112 RepID=A0A1I1FH88_9RHOB|nr:molecular chaperone TorD family protein [Tropicimonas isoalkanivorans]SFB98316.1 Nitrate reductase delta subunit [Tropicimonas isoalkanivorans]
MTEMVKRAVSHGSEVAMARGQIYSFLELAFGHPAEKGIEYFRQEFVERSLHQTLGKLDLPSAFDEGMFKCFDRFFKNIRESSIQRIEGDYIKLFSSNYPIIPCPPYGSLFTVDETKRLEEMAAVKEAYQESGMTLSDKHEELPDHLGVELEFLQYLSFRESESLQDREEEIVKFWRDKQAHFLARFVVPFVTQMALIAEKAEPDNIYSDLVGAIRHFVVHHSGEFTEIALEFNGSLEDS